MSNTTLWLVIIVTGILTFAIRFSFIVGWGRFSLPPLVQRALRFVPVAVLVALIVPDVLLRDGLVYAAMDNNRLWAALVAVAVAALTRNTFLTIGVGFGVLLLLQSWSGVPLF